MIRRLVTALIVIPLGLILVVFAVANRHAVTLSLDPFGADSPALTATLPLFLLILLLLALGVIVGGIATWFGQAKWRRAARRLDAEVHALRIQRDALKGEVAAKEQALVAHPRELPTA
jgi:uncharacterized integral membrane protein